MSEIVTIGIALETSALQAGARQAADSLRTLQQDAARVQGSLGTVGSAASGADRQLRALPPGIVRITQAERELTQATRDTTATLQSQGRVAQGLGQDFARLAFSYISFRAALSGGREIVDATFKTEALAAAFRGITGSSKGSAEEIAFVRQQAQRLGVDFGSLAEGYKQVAAAARGTTLEGQKSRAIFLAIAEAGSVYKLSATQVEGALRAVSQMISTGVVQADEFKQQLANHLPGASQIAARALGVTTAEFFKMMEAGQLGLDFISKFTEQLQKELGGSVAASAETASAAFTRLTNAIQHAASEMGSVVLPKLAPFTNWLADVIEKTAQVAENYRKMRDEQGKLAQTRTEGTGVPASAMRSLEDTVASRKGALDYFQQTGQDPRPLYQRPFSRYDVEAERAQLAKDEAALRQIRQEAAAQRTRLDMEREGGEERFAPSGPSYKGLGAVPEQYKEMVRRAAEQYRLDPAVFAALVEQESGFKPNAKSSAGAMGLTQLMPGTAGDMGVSNPYDPWQNVYGGAKYLRQQLNTYRGDYSKALMAYNAGPGNVDNGEALRKPETVNYVRSIQAITARNRGDMGGPLANVNYQDPAELRKADSAAEQERKKQAREAEQEQQKAFNRQLAYGEALSDADKKVAEQKMRLQDQLQDKIDEASGSEEEAFRRRAEKAGFEGQELEALIALRQQLNDAQADKRGLQMLEKLEEATAELTMTERERFELQLQHMRTTPGMTSQLLAAFDTKEAAERSVSTEDEARDAINRFRANPNYAKAAGIDPAMDKAYATGLEMIDRWSDRIADFVAKGKLDFKALADSAIAEFLRISIKSALTTLYNTETVQGWLQWGMKAVRAGTAVAGVGGGGYDAATGIAVGSSAVYPLAEGGPMYAGRPYLVGERGAELIVPQQNGTVIPNSKLGGGIAVTVNMNGVTDMNSFQRSRAELQRSLISAMQAAQRSA